MNAITSVEELITRVKDEVRLREAMEEDPSTKWGEKTRNLMEGELRDRYPEADFLCDLFSKFFDEEDENGKQNRLNQSHVVLILMEQGLDVFLEDLQVSIRLYDAHKH